MKKPLSLLGIFLILLCMLTPASARAQEDRQYYLGTPVNAGKDTGYSKTKSITESDPHFGWSLGKFYVTGYTSDTVDASGNPIFLKTVGDRVTLWFHLEQNIDHLAGSEKLTISEDTNGYDQYFGIPKTNFGRGTLIIRHTDHQNFAADPVIYTNYLAASATYGAATQVELFEEGDYEVALNYEIQEDKLDVLGASVLPGYTNYRIFFKFSVRNGNCMVYPFDVATGAELTNTAITEKGFCLDLARSRYLDIQIKREILAEGAQGLTEDVRFNRPAREGDKYTEEGIYTITVHNRYTNQQTTKVIYVGTDDVLKAHVTSGLSIPEINSMLASGAHVDELGNLVFPVPETTAEPTAGAASPPAAETTEPQFTVSSTQAPSQEPPAAEGSPLDTPSDSPVPWGKIGIGAVAVAVAAGLIYFIRDSQSLRRRRFRVRK